MSDGHVTVVHNAKFCGVCRALFLGTAFGRSGIRMDRVRNAQKHTYEVLTKHIETEKIPGSRVTASR